ncbi:MULTISPECIES: hypothetical protein [unclassified Paenibacillus]|uniref:hypothetical protein n=1 Tax=unclassified Paenibacillus TaxID=185978 RepID=UPI00240614AF|nr:MULTISPECIES: hypothetical protein [unclassified Paenibacillus]MDF9845133.1 hypothetical protein [Paenibacillus sp. PastF-2]MDF9851732.1 hypothetical protein [Paenibacillus sp. PastM-2]MDF9858315.1 hypothetical protein [Paenibacillus sp. PastF-1]MDH6483605.1 hypothetical protein [Paenibacillus sp. PastH-2]MDH6510990.1 hypothetical protein [Paenibacillus sp. PastM-3]
MTDYKHVESTHWTPKQIAVHCKAIGADKPPAPRKYQDQTITAPQLGFNNKYIKKGGATR